MLRGIGGALTHAHLGLVALAVALHVVGLIITGERWRVVIAALGSRLSLYQTTLINLAGIFVRNATPTTGLGGDASRIALLRAHDQLKFVLSDRRDYEFARGVLAEHPDMKTQLLFQPMWASPNPVTVTKLEGEPATLQHVAEWVLADGIDARVGTQLHKVIWGHEKGR